MKNLKKVLALVLAFACAFTMFAGAAFTDQADIEAAEAVDMLTALGVIDGYEDGSFQPNETVTRAEMAKMIYTIRNGGNATVTQYEGYKTPFADVENTGHWAKGYIAYCYANGIIDGKSATSFDPDATVTGTEAAKMALVLIGYDAERAGLEGSSWTTNTINLATQKDLFKDFSISITGGCDRQYAAQLLYNTLWACTVRWSSDAEGYEDVVTYEDSKDGTTAKPLNVTVAKRYMGLEELTGTYYGNEKVTSVLDGRISVGENEAGKPYTATYDLGLEWLGEEVKVLYKESKDGVDGLDPKDTVFGVYNTGETTVYNIVKGDLQDGDSVKNKIKFGDEEYDAAADITTYVNYVKVTPDESVKAFDKGEAAGTNKYAVASNDAIKFVCNASGDITTAYVTTSQFGKVSTVTSDKIAIEGVGTKELKDCEVYEGVQAGDLVRYTENFAGSKTVNVIEKADTVTGTIASFKSSDSQVQVDGNWYKFGANKTVATDYTNEALTNSDVGDEVVLIVDGGYYLAYDKISNFNAYAIATLGNAEFGDRRVKLLKADGSETTAVVDELSNGASLTGMNENDAATGKLFAYDLKSDDTKVDLSAKEYTAASSIASGKFNGDNNTITIGSDPAKIVASDAAVFVYVAGTDNKWKVYTAKELGNFDLTASSNVQYITDDGKIVALAVQAGSFPTGGSDSTAYGYVVNREDTKLGDDNVVMLEIWDGETNVKLYIDGREGITAYAGDFVQFPVVGEDVKVSKSDVKVETAGTATTGESDLFKVVKVKEFSADDKLLLTTTDTVDSDNKVVSGEDTSWSVASDVKIIGVNTADKEGASMKTVPSYTKAYDNDYANAFIVYDEKAGYNEVKAIFIDADNKLTSYTEGGSASTTGKETIYTITPASVETAVNGLTADVTVDKTKALAGQTVTVTVTVSGTAAAASKTITASGDGVASPAYAGSDLTNMTLDKDTGVTVTDTVKTSGTFTYTFEVTANAEPTVTIQA